MSTTYMLRKPMKPEAIAKLTGWAFETASDPDCNKGKPYPVLRGPGGYVHPWEDDKGRVVGFDRYGRNDPFELVEALDPVSEHDEEDPDYERLFGVVED